MARRSRVAVSLLQISAVVLFVVGWTWAVDRGDLSRISVGSPSGVIDVLKQWWAEGTVWSAIGYTFYVLCAGLGIGAFIGVLLGAAIGLSDILRDALEPFVIFFNGMPRLVLYPVLAIILGFGQTSQILFVALVVVVVVALNVAAGFREVPTTVLANMRILGARRFRLFQHVYLPSLSWWLLSASRVTIGYGFQAAIVAGFLGPPNGLGYLVSAGQQSLDVSIVLAGLSVIILLALAIESVLAMIEAFVRSRGGLRESW
jgi:NitT/TauT family transport system permease protein